MHTGLKDRIEAKTTEELIALIESEQGDYTEEAISIARIILGQRSWDEYKVLQYARDLMKTKILAYLKQFDVINDTLVLPTSNLLTEEEVKSIFSETFTRWKNEQDDMIPDGWQYVLAAGLG